jgi:NAD(P)H-flavin reductase/quinol-cytochrome oxidoreductase complex cytochrome b subunit
MLKRTQAAGQWLFLKAENVFNVFFGDRLNPLYHIGSISYWLFWIVVASGFYLYAFYRTGIDETYQSVEALTNGQWYLGGIMRSVHRYASDGMVLTMLLHLARHFVFDHYRSFRWFSWVTGVVVLWLVYASGINGYMLPWDGYAQFVLTATAEWLDVLPMFGKTLIRNFIYQEAVNDRFFSLLSFLHIGIPLAVLALLWVHTQRVPKAKTAPPWPIAWSLLISLVVLSLVKPALSQGPAVLDHVAAIYAFDWFYLPVYPLLYSWTPLEVWLLVGGATGLMFLAPWLPPRFRKGPAEGYRATFHPSDRTIAVKEGESLLEAGLREDMPLGYDCRNGGCGVCKCTLLAGEVEFGAYQKSALSDDERALGKVLSCCAYPRSDVVIEFVPVGAMPGFVVQEARVESMQRIAHDVMIVRLKLVDGGRIAFGAGQYINILLPDGERRAFSFATAPQDNEFIELHIRLIPGGRFTTHVFNDMKVGETVRFEGPLGSLALQDGSNRPVIFVAGATGFAPVKSLLEHAFATGSERRMFLYWGVRRRRDLYCPELPEQWEREHPNFTFVPVLSEAAPEDHWPGRTGLVHQAILADFPSLAGHEIYACGSMQMVEVARPSFIAQGLSEDACFSDAFLPASASTND